MATIVNEYDPAAPAGTSPSSANTSPVPSDVIQRARPGLDNRETTVRVREILNRHPAVGLAVGVVRNGHLEFFYGHGVADIASQTPITEDTVFRIASITKTFTAIAVMQLWEHGLIDLDAPANDYLRAYKLIAANVRFRPATPRDLLTHSAGVPEQVHPFDLARPDWGETVKLGERVPTLAEYYRGRLRLVAEPGSQFIYGDHSPATLGQIVEDVSGKALRDYFRDHIFEPLGMADTDLVRSDRIVSNLATGYALSESGPQVIADRLFIPVGAVAIYSTAGDMARYLAALLGGGVNDHGSILKPESVTTIFAPHYRPDTRIPGMGLGFIRGDVGGHLTVEHPGILPGFNAQISLAPGDGVGVLALTNGAREAVHWMPVECSQLLGDLLGVPPADIRTDVPQHPEIWGDICGWYTIPIPLTDARTRLFFGAGVEVFVRRGELMLRLLNPIPVLYRGFPLHPDEETDPYVFRVDLSEFGMGTIRVVFNHDKKTGTMVLHFDVSPVSLSKQPATTNPRLWVTRALGGLAAITAVGAARRRLAR